NGNAEGGFVKWREKQKPAQKLLRQMGKNGVDVEDRRFGIGHFIRPAFIQFMNCQNILIEDVQIENVPFWVIQPTYCKNVTVRSVRIDSRNLNNDGCDPDSSEDVLIEDCWFRTGDDAIAIKSGRDNDGWRINRPSRNIVIRNCKAELTLHGVAIGSELSGGVENVYIQNFSMKKVDAFALQFKSNQDRGGYIRNVHIDGMDIDSTNTAIYFTNDYHSYSGGNSPTSFENISIKNLTCNNAANKGIDMVGLENKPIKNIQFENVRIFSAKKGNRMINVKDVSLRNVLIDQKQIQSIKDFQKEEK
ncbi:MAG: polygalacturonase, partial [Bacteroidia bacterium]